MKVIHDIVQLYFFIFYESTRGIQCFPAATTTAALGDGSTTGGITLDVDGAISIGAAVLTTGAVTVTLFWMAFQNLC